MTERSSYQLSKISNVMLGVADLDASVAFYRDMLGMTVRFQSPGFAFLDGGGVTLCLSEPLHRACTQTVGATEIVFAVEDVAEAHSELRQRGVTFTIEPRKVTPTDWAANFADPDGHRLSIFGPSAQHG